MKKIISFLLALLMIVSAIPFTDVSEVFTVEAGAESTVTLENGDYFNFGSYPQSEVTDEAIKTSLTELAGDTSTWTSYNYYIESEQSDFMKYTDVEYDGEKYRGVYFTSYRPKNTSSSTDNGYQYDNRYYIYNIYWFKYEPITWTVLDDESGLAISNLVLDAQEYFCNGSGRTINNKTIYSNNWEYSNIRKWLNDSFYYTAFSEDEQNLIKTTTHENNAYNKAYSEYNASSTDDKLFTLSYSETNEYWSCSTEGIAINTDYAKCQGLYNNNNYSSSWWWLRSPSYDRQYTCAVGSDGYLISDYELVTFNVKEIGGIRPVFCLSQLSGIAESGITVWEKTGTAPTCITNGEYTYINPITKDEISKKITKLKHLDKDNDGYCEKCNTIINYSKVIPSFQNGITYSFGSYPQSKVTDTAITSILTEKAGSTNNWTSYDYYISSDKSDFMKYTDVEYNGEKYRGVYFTSYRPNFISYSSSTNYSYQDNNEYYTYNIYWFKYEPITWTVLDAATGLIVSSLVLDAQEFYYNYSNRTIDEQIIFSNNWEYSNIRNWLNDTFYNTAFTKNEQELINATVLENKAYTTTYSPYDANNTKDNVFLLSRSDAENYWSTNVDRCANNTDYAKCQGAYNDSDSGTNNYWLRTPIALDTACSYFVSYNGYITNDYTIPNTHIGIRPALCLNVASSILKTENDFVYYILEDTANIVNYSDTEATEVAIPDTLGGYPVASIGASSFSECPNLKKVVISDGITSINNSAFENCKALEEVTIGSGVTVIGENAFKNCIALKNVTIPAGVTTLSSDSFNGCTSIESFTVDENNANYYSDRNGIIFSKADNSCVCVPEGRKNVEIYNGFDVSILEKFPVLETVNLAADVEEVADGAFKNLKTLQSFTVDEDNENYSAENGVLYSSTKRRFYCYPAGKTDTAFTFPAKVTRCSPYAFYNNAYLEKLDIPSTISIIDEYTFANCTALKEITIPSSAISIGNYAFSGETALEKINWNANALQSSLQSANIFNKCGTKSDGITITFGSNVTTIPAYLFYNSGANLKEIVGENIANVGNYAFYNCGNLTDVKFGSSIESFGNYCFQNCSSIENVYIGSIEKWITASFGSQISNPLYYAKNLYVNNELYKDLVLDKASSVTVSNYVFYNFKGLENIDIKSTSSVTLGNYSFNNCDGLKSVNLESTKITVNQNTFDDCGANETLKIKSDSGVSLANYSFRNNDSLKSVDINGTSVTLGQYSFYDCDALESYNMSDATGTIGSYAFASCDVLNSARIGNGITSIGESAFADCLVLPSIIVPVSTTKINGNAFSGCKKLKDIYVLNADCISADSVQNTIYKNTVIHSHEGYSVEAYADLFGFDFEPMHIGVGEYYTSAKCTQPGEQYQKCKYCDEYANVTDVPALGHSFTNYVSDNNATCTADGTKTAKCDRCDATDTVTDVGSKLGHNYVAIVTKPTCTTKGFTTNVCSRCTDTYTDNETEALGHTPAEAVKENVVEVKCTTDGSYDEVIYCSVCKAELSRTSVAVNKLGHTEVVDKTVAPTCTATGLTAGKHCSVCKAVLVAQKTVPALGHKFDDGKVTKAATCNATGLKTYTCTVCKATKTETIAKTTTHNYKNVVTAATLTKDGKIQSKCSVCGKIAKTTAIAKIASVKLSKTAYTYTGKALKPTVTVKDSNGKVIKATNYTVTYKNNTNVGKATVTVKFKGNYSGTKTLTFTISPKATTLSKIASTKKGTATVTVKKQATQTTGYEIQYSTSAKFTTSTTKTVKITSAKTLTKTISKLTSGKTYYFRVRTYKTVSKVDYTSAWSKSIKAKIK